MIRRWGGALLALAGVLATSLPADAGQGPVIRRTSYGIPHIKAADYQGLGVGLGYAFAEDNACVMADIAVTLSAERSRWFGPEAATKSGENNLVSDLYHQRINQSQVIERLLAAPRGPSRPARDLVRGYADGFNRYLAKTGAANLPDAACRGAQWVRPITEIDVWRRAYQVAAFDGGEAFQDMIVSAQPPGASVPAPAAAPLRRPEDIGSNAIAVGKAATAGGTGMVLGNPHFLWPDDWRFYQQQMTIPGELNVSGAGLAGLPLVNIGHNDRMAWSHTSSTVQTATITKLTLAPGSNTSYVVDGQMHPMVAEHVTVSARQADGSIAPVTRTLYRTPEGPVLEASGPLEWSGTNAFVLHDANAGNLRTIDQWLAIARSRNVSDLNAALIRHQGLPWVNTIAADDTGTSYYSDIQVVPHVTDELQARCGTGPEIGRVVLDGSRSACGWGSDPGTVAPGLLSPSKLPSLTRQDYVSNMNNSPWLANPAAPLTGYPAIVGNAGTERSPRTRLGLDMIADRLDGSDGLGTPGFTLSTLQATMFGNRNLTAEQGRQSIVAMCQANPTLVAHDGRPVDVRAACAALAAWNGRGDTGEAGRGAFLWRVFMNMARRPDINLWKVPFDPADPARTPRDVNAGNPDVRQAFADAAQLFAAAGVPVDVPLDAIQSYAGIPIHGCSGPEGCFNVISVPGAVGRTSEISHGTSYIMAAELTKTGPRMRSLLVYSQSANQASPHHTDQTRLYANKQWVTGLFTEQEIARDPNLTVRIVPS
ncbi:acyl-homoserine-lactone acylase [Kibdelosporangium banguiense]|uniref:Acyl-homoserine-lactone acylase n=1 Tax=Kibdelosporangium banguiense TaxID=1365924 RepID=A0ABS4TFA3_9PSEU|nr:penicillin acylase family protein [Kibdelosporangium banguiense]MBP2323097.1 acyl-homoserine-lactone acylase [Kibdelosporangium banguiense]